VIRLACVNTGAARAIATKSGRSGIAKTPRDGMVEIGALGLDGDTIVDTDNHGGRDQAVYAYGLPDYAFWESELGRPLPPGTFGENLTLEGVASADFAVGDRLHIGDTVLEVTSPRIPCVTLGAHMGDAGFVRRFARARRPGPYFRVIAPGTVTAGDRVRHIPFDGPRLSIADLADMTPPARLSDADLDLRLATPVHRLLRATCAAERDRRHTS